MFEREADLAISNKRIAERIYISVGELESNEVIQQSKEFAEAIRSRKYQNLEVKYDLIEDEGHVSIINQVCSNKPRQSTLCFYILL